MKTIPILKNCAPGIDEQNFAYIKEMIAVEEFLYELQSELRDGKYTAMAAFAKIYLH